MPALERENEIPLSLFLLLKDQCIMSDGYPIALILPTARSEISAVLPDKQDQDACLSRIIAAHKNLLEIIREKREEQLGKVR